jgi:hypothetical protein
VPRWRIMSLGAAPEPSVNLSGQVRRARTGRRAPVASADHVASGPRCRHPRSAGGLRSSGTGERRGRKSVSTTPPRRAPPNQPVRVRVNDELVLDAGTCQRVQVPDGAEEAGGRRPTGGQRTCLGSSTTQPSFHELRQGLSTGSTGETPHALKPTHRSFRPPPCGAV